MKGIKEDKDRIKMSKEKVFDDIVGNDMLSLDYNTIIAAVAKINGKSFARSKECLDELIEEGSLKLSNGRIENNSKTLRGKIRTIKGKQCAFLEIENGEQIYIFNKMGVVDGDEVEIILRNRFGKQEGVISNVISKNTNSLFGCILKNQEGEYCFYPSDDKFEEEVILAGDNLYQAVGMKVKVDLSYADVNFIGNKKNAIIGFVDKIYGKAGDPIVENVVIAEKYGFNDIFSEETIKEVSLLPTEVIEKDWKECIDLTDLPFCTIDPKNCKDMDDAIYVNQEKNGDYHAYIAIADVSNYVKEFSSIDEDAFNKGINCYLGDRVYPILPEEISNGICSLDERKNRRVLCIDVYVNLKGEITSYNIINAIINSRHKLSYQDAENIHLDLENKYLDVQDSINNAYELSDILIKKRKARGAISINKGESTYIFGDDKTKVADVVDETGISSTKVIESLMILGDEIVGNMLVENKEPGLFRIHEYPKKEKIEKLQNICAELGIFYSGDSTSKGLNKLLNDVKGSQYEDFINLFVLKSMERARYQVENIGHFALGTDCYSHFTAGIRRYSDIIVQRAIKNIIENKKGVAKEDDISVMSDYLNKREIDSENADIESRQLLNVIWAEDHIGQTFKGNIIALSSNGLFTKIKDKNIELYIPLKNLVKNKKCKFKLNKMKTILATNNEVSYKIGDEIDAIIESTDRNTRTITATCLVKKKNIVKEIEEKPKTYIYYEYLIEKYRKDIMSVINESTCFEDLIENRKKLGDIEGEIEKDLLAIMLLKSIGRFKRNGKLEDNKIIYNDGIAEGLEFKFNNKKYIFSENTDKNEDSTIIPYNEDNIYYVKLINDICKNKYNIDENKFEK